MGLILDTSVLISAERGRFDLSSFLDTEAPGMPIFITAITAAELLHGVHRAKGRVRKRREVFVEDILSAIPTLPFDETSARSHARLWARLEESGQRIGAHDLIIASIALTLGHPLATLNEREFVRVEELGLANARPHHSPS